MLTLLVAGLMFSTAPAQRAADTTGCWEPPSEAWVETPGVALISPGGTAPPLGDQGLVVEVLVLDCNGDPIPGFPASDIWMDDPGDGSISKCPNSSPADHDTDENGLTTISGAVFGGGHSLAGTQVFVAGVPLLQPPLPLDFVSPDIDGDLVVDIVDFSLFGMDFHTTASRSDFNVDGQVNIIDLSIFGLRFNETCP